MSRPEVIGVLLLEGYPIIPFSCVVDALRSANRLSQSELYHWVFYSPDDQPVGASCGITVPTRPLSSAAELDALVVCASNEAQHFDHEATLHKLRELGRRRVRLGSVSSGSYLLARAGLLDRCRCTIHWENIAIFRELYPQVNVAFSLYEIAGRRFTCSGGTAALDMMLKLIENRHGRQLAQAISRQFQHDRIRTEFDSQQMADRIDLAMSAPRLIDVIELMESNIESPLPLPEISRYCGLSLRQIERLFRKYRQVTPSRYYLALRLDHARQLLLNTDRSLIDVSIASGFENQSNFCASYRRQFGLSPRRHRAQVAAEHCAGIAG